MTNPASNPSPARLPAPERIRVIRRSSRAVVYGTLGIIPVLGWFPALYALRMHRQICRATGESWQGTVGNFWLGMLALLGGLCVGAGGWAVGTMIFFLVLGALGYRMVCYLQQGKARLWNPGRRALFYGMTLAWSGLAFSFWLLGIVMGVVIWSR